MTTLAKEYSRYVMFRVLLQGDACKHGIPYNLHKLSMEDVNLTT